MESFLNSRVTEKETKERFYNSHLIVEMRDRKQGLYEFKVRKFARKFFKLSCPSLTALRIAALRSHYSLTQTNWRECVHNCATW